MDIATLLKSFSEFDSKHGKIELHRTNLSELKDLENISELTPSEAIRKFLTLVVSFKDDEKQKRKDRSDQRSSPAKISLLDDEEIEGIASLYIPDVAKSLPKDDEPSEPRADGQNSVEYLFYLLKKYIPYDKKRRKQISDSLDLAKKPFHDSFLNRSISDLGLLGSLKQTRVYEAPHIQPSPIVAHAKETARSTQKSTEFLEQLAETAAIFMDTANRRDIEAKRQSKTQLYIAVAGIWLSVIPAFAGLWYAYKSYTLAQKADLDNGLFQSQMIDLINRNTDTIAVTNKNLLANTNQMINMQPKKGSTRDK